MLIGIFNMGLKVGDINLSMQDEAYIHNFMVQDGSYTNLIDDQDILIENSKIQLSEKPVIIRLCLNEN